LKSIVQLGHVPKLDDQSSRAWLYGKLFVALLSQKLARVGALFPPGTTIYPKKPPTRSRWREFQFAFHRVVEAIAPAVGLETVLARWNQIAAALGERNRQRKRSCRNGGDPHATPPPSNPALWLRSLMTPIAKFFNWSSAIGQSTNTFMFPPEVHQALLRAPSKGQYFNRAIRGQFAFALGPEPSLRPRGGGNNKGDPN
jgi:hypothetical protein